MAIIVEFTAECDKCKTRKPIAGLVGFDVRLPQGWISNYESGVLCDACKEDKPDNKPISLNFN